MLVYDHGKLISQTEIIDENEDESVKNPPAFGTIKKVEDIKAIASE